MSDTPLVRKYIDSVNGMAHQSAIEIIINLEKKLEAADNRNTRNYYADGYEAGYQAGMAEWKPWVGMTDDEFKTIMLDTYNIDLNVPGHSSDDHLLWAAIEASLKEKNGG